MLRQVESHITIEILDHATRQALPQPIVHFDTHLALLPDEQRLG
jgi:hypothetical protein